MEDHNQEQAKRHNEDLIYGGLALFWFFLFALWMLMAWEQTLHQKAHAQSEHVSTSYPKPDMATAQEEIRASSPVKVEPKLAAIEIIEEYKVENAPILEEITKEEIVAAVVERVVEESGLPAMVPGAGGLEPDGVVGGSAGRSESAASLRPGVPVGGGDRSLVAVPHPGSALVSGRIECDGGRWTGCACG